MAGINKKFNNGTPGEVDIELLSNLIMRVGKFNVLDEFKSYLESENLFLLF